MIRDCDNCKHKMCWEYAEPCSSCTNMTGEPTNWEPQTNADRIRAMSDEELARFIDDVLKYNIVGEPDENVCCDCHKTDCAPCWLGWLKSPVEEGDNG